MRNKEDYTNEAVEIRTALGLIPNCGTQAVLDAIADLHEEISFAKKELAPFCAEVDPSRTSLRSTVDLLICEVLEPLHRK